MKTTIYFKGVMLLLFFSSTLTSALSQAYKISGRIIGLDTGKAELVKTSNNQTIILDSTHILDGGFVFIRQFEEPQEFQVKVKQLKKTISFFVDSSTDLYFQMDINKNEINIKGGDSQGKYEELKIKIDSISSLRYGLFAKYNKLKEAKDSIGLEKLSLDFDQNSELKINALQNFIEQNHESPVSIYALRLLSESVIDPGRLKFYYDKLPKSFQEFPTMRLIAERISKYEGTKIGSQAPIFQQRDVDRKFFSFNSLRGYYVLLDFWASWCAPCRKDNIHLVTVFNRFKNMNFMIVSVSLDKPGDHQKWINAIKKDGIGNWINLSDLKFMDNEVAKLYAVQSIPRNFLIDPSGQIISIDLKGENLELKLQEIFGK